MSPRRTARRGSRCAGGVRVCPVRVACLAYALRTRPAAGVWAGFTPDEIAALVAAANRPARPRRGTALRPASTGPAAVSEVA